ncbi:MAG: FAD-dependent oxidoreductase [Anaerolineales bacterium]|nr:FAD-dependent oxidoreductase [Anaerolineales bacterium]
MDKHDVIIIGGGIAGLTAALHLAERGLKPLILESNEHIGGRLAGLPETDVKGKIPCRTWRTWNLVFLLQSQIHASAAWRCRSIHARHRRAMDLPRGRSRPTREHWQCHSQQHHPRAIPLHSTFSLAAFLGHAHPARHAFYFQRLVGAGDGAGH